MRFFAQLRCSAFSFSPCALLARNRNRCCEFFHLPPPSTSQTKRRCVQRPCLPTAAALPVSKEMGLHRNHQSVVACNRRPRVETAAALTMIVLAPRVCRTRGPCPPKGTNVSPEHWGRQVISADDRLGSVEMRVRGLTPRRKDASCADDSLPLVRGLRPPDATGSRHTKQPAHAGVGGHHTTVSPLFFIAYPQTRVPAPSVLGPYAVAAGAGPQPMLSITLKLAS